jgi:hypothetical protein
MVQDFLNALMVDDPSIKGMFMSVMTRSMEPFSALAKSGSCFRSICCRQHAIAARLENFFRNLQYRKFIVNNKNVFSITNRR